jgi:NLI interacting factor-like phosphatase
MPSSKPILFHDIDGVLFGEYAGHFQLRPGVRSWLTWAHEHFSVIWLTSWEKEHVEQLLDVLYLRNFLPIQYGNWTNYSNKAIWLKQISSKLGTRKAVWIDDNAEPVDGIEVMLVNPAGEKELVTLQNRLSRFLEQKAA